MKKPKLEYVKVWKLRPEILLCPNIPKPLHGMAPRVVLGQRWWDFTRKAAYKSTNYRCQACGVHKYRAKSKQWLEGHELYYTDYRRGRLTYLETVPLCHYCHNYIHDGRLLHLLEKREITQGKYIAVIQHGNRVLAEAGLQRLTHTERDKNIAALESDGKLAPWESWRLVVFGKEYKPLFKNIDEWRAQWEV